MINERLSGVTAFVQVVEAGSFALAAERLRVTRSAVGKTIARLEQRLGARLFHRTTRRQSLTDDGQAYYERCVRALAELDAAEAAFETGRREPLGRLRVSAPVLFGRHCVAPVLRDLMRAHPRLEIELSFNDRVVDLLEDGFDIAVRVGALADSTNLVARCLGTQHMSICASPAYLAEHGHPTSVQAMDGHIGIAYGRAGYDLPWRVRGADGRIEEPKIKSALRFDDLQAIADAAVAGIGLAWLPCWLVSRHVHAGELVLVMDSEVVVASDIHAVWPKMRHLPSKTRVAIDALVAEIPKMIGVSGAGGR